MFGPRKVFAGAGPPGMNIPASVQPSFGLPMPWQQSGHNSDPNTQPNGMFPLLPPAGGANELYVPVTVLQQCFQPVLDQAAASYAELRELQNESAEQKCQLDKLGSQLGLKRHLPDTPGDEGDDEGDGPDSNSSWVASKLKRACKGKDQLKPEELHAMQEVYCRVITCGCKVKHFNELKLEGLDKEELREVDENWDQPWRPDFARAWSDCRNQIWVEKINDAVMDDEWAKELVAKGNFPALCFNKQFMSQYILSNTWAHCHSGAKVNENFNGAAQRHEGNNTKGKHLLHRKQLLECWKRAVTRDPNDPKVGIRFKWEGKDIPPELLTLEITSNVISDKEYEVDGIWPLTTVEDHQKAHQQHDFEGVKPFYRHKMWDKIFAAMDGFLNPPKGTTSKLTACYYAVS
ncbi:hypothetical protein CTheo_9060 [Ceratobasidium theobromae]|uniref:Uncharacterized protein n=1 Tax=Ceratobasidium theobromae TaxID=1582974 RepID=A0A5N5Q7T5_9AGAM|nr:hypothetical protein CTheo_9060 [Ceratobasidium theobromae]